MKRLFAVIAGIAIYFTMAITVSAFNVVRDDNYESGDLSDYTLSSPALTAEIIEDSENEGNHIMHLQCPATQNVSVTTSGFDSDDNKVILEMNIKKNNTTGSLRVMQIWTTNGNRAALIGVSSSGVLSLNNSINITDSDISNVNGKWINIRVILDFTSQQFDFYVNGIFRRTAPFGWAGAGTVSKVETQIENGAELYIDNYRIYSTNNAISDAAYFDAVNQFNTYSAIKSQYSSVRFNNYEKALQTFWNNNSVGLTETQQNELVSEMNKATALFEGSKIRTNAQIYSHASLTLNEEEKTDDISSAAGDIGISFDYTPTAGDAVNTLAKLIADTGEDLFKVYSDGAKIYVHSQEGDTAVCDVVDGETMSFDIEVDIPSNTFGISVNGGGAISGTFLSESYSVGMVKYIADTGENFELTNVNAFYKTVINDIVASYAEETVFTAGNTDINYMLSAIVKDNFGNQQNVPIVYTLTNTITDVSLLGDILTIKPGVQGDVKIRASVEDIYTDAMIHLVDYSTVTIKSITAKDGKITIIGSVIRRGVDDIVLTITGDNVNETSVITEESDGTFTAEYNVAEGLNTTECTLNVNGNTTYTLQKTFTYFGPDAQSVVLTRINSGDDTVIRTAVEVFGEYLTVSGKTFKEHTTDYVNMIKARTYATLDEFNEYAAEINFIINFNNAVRGNIEQIINDNMQLIVNNQFSATKFNRILGTDKESDFYVKAAMKSGGSVSDIVGELNTIVNELVQLLEEKPIVDGDGEPASNPKPPITITPIYPDETVPSTPSVDTDEEIEPTERVPFDDEDEAEWAKPAIIYMHQRGIISGDGNKLRPRENIKRGEIAKILVCAFEIEPGLKSTGGAWWQEYADRGEKAGIMYGYEDGEFHGEDLLKRQDLAVLLQRIIKYKSITVYNKAEEKIYNDNDDISDYAQEAIRDCQIFGIMSGMGENMFAPKAYVTRAQAIQAVYNLMTVEEASGL